MGAPARIAAIYAALGCAWIAWSDAAIGAIGLTSKQMVIAGTVKGWAFVALTTAVLYRLVRGLVRDAQAMAAEAQREHAEKLKAANLLSTIAETSTDAIFAKDAAGRYLLMNRQALRMVGRSADEVIGRDDRDLFPPAEAEQIMAEDRTILDSGSVRTFEERVTTAGGAMALLTTKGPIPGEDGRPIGVFGITRDISQRVAAEQALRERNEQLAQSNADLEQFAYVASHDLREPLRMVSGYVAMLERRYGQSLDEEAHEFIGFAREGAQRLDRMVLDLLEFSRVGRMSEPFAPVPLAEVVETARLNLSAVLAESRGNLVVATGLPVVQGARGELVRLLQNLIGNALKYRHADRPPVVAVSCRAEGGNWQVSVADNGIGIGPQYFDKIFHIFQRLHTRERYDGTGIGLAICRRIVKHHGGQIWLDSVPGEGSVFHFTLPRAD
ncbi:MAG: sensor histidine kinase [Actinomycetota bacterium]